MSSKPGIRHLQPHSCLRCQLRPYVRVAKQIHGRVTPTKRRASSTTTTSFNKSSTEHGFYPPPEQLQKRAYAHLTNRSLIKLQGPDVVSFLNGLLPSSLQPLSKNASNPIFTAFLSAKGRLLYDVFIYPPNHTTSSNSWYFDVDAGSAASLLSHLKKHKLRSKFKLEKISPEDLGVYYVWPERDNGERLDLEIGGQDPRPLMGTRFLSSVHKPSSVLSTLQDAGPPLTLRDYKIHRMISGHAEGPSELIANSALPQESNIDFYHGIDFHKGCYLGQELTIRTHHTGVVRKRVLPCQISSKPILIDQEVPVYNADTVINSPPLESNISKVRTTGRSSRSTGKWLGGVGNIGLALCRLEMMTDIQLTAEGTNYNPDDQFKIVWEDGDTDSEGKTTVREVSIRPFVPSWLRQNIEVGIQARSERSKKKRKEVEEYDEDESV